MSTDVNSEDQIQNSLRQISEHEKRFTLLIEEYEDLLEKASYSIAFKL